MPQSIPPGLTQEHVLKALADLDAGIEHLPGGPPGALGEPAPLGQDARQAMHRLEDALFDRFGDAVWASSTR